MQVDCFACGRCISAGGGGAAYSTDGGLTWAAASTGPGYDGTAVPLSCSDASDCMVTLSIIGTAQPVSVSVSHDGGRSWQPVVAQGLPSDKVFTSISCPSRSACWAAGDAVAGPGGGLMFPGTGGVLVSTTSGAGNWRDASLPHGVSGIWAVSCPGTHICFALASKASVASSSTPSQKAPSYVLLAYGAPN